MFFSKIGRLFGFKYILVTSNPTNTESGLILPKGPGGFKYILVVSNPPKTESGLILPKEPDLCAGLLVSCKR